MGKQLTPNFSEGELNVEDSEQRIKDNAHWLCEHILEPMRTHFGEPVSITSGHRPEDANAATGGVKTSFHLYKGTESAADCLIVGVSIRTLFDWLRLESPLPFDKVIEETDSVGNPQVVHIQADPFNTRPRTAWIGETHGRSGYVEVQCNAIPAA